MNCTPAGSSIQSVVTYFKIVGSVQCNIDRTFRESGFRSADLYSALSGSVSCTQLSNGCWKICEIFKRLRSKCYMVWRFVGGRQLMHSPSIGLDRALQYMNVALLQSLCRSGCVLCRLQSMFWMQFMLLFSCNLRIGCNLAICLQLHCCNLCFRCMQFCLPVSNNNVAIFGYNLICRLQSICRLTPSVRLSVSPSFRPPARPPVCMSLHPSAHPSVRSSFV